VAVEAAAGQLLRVCIEDTPNDIDSWSVFFGNEAERLYSGNPVPLAVSEAWLESGELLQGKPATFQPQAADVFVRLDQRIQRG
jgi:hypothetical protein